MPLACHEGLLYRSKMALLSGSSRAEGTLENGRQRYDTEALGLGLPPGETRHSLILSRISSVATAGRAVSGLLECDDENIASGTGVVTTQREMLPCGPGVPSCVNHLVLWTTSHAKPCY
ncbi:unnamed protein product [Lota lota]